LKNLFLIGRVFNIGAVMVIEESWWNVKKPLN